MRLTRILGLFAVVWIMPVIIHADNAATAVDNRFVGSWEFNGGLGTVLFHTSFANGDFKRIIYDQGKVEVVAKGKWYSDAHAFHIIIFKRMTPLNPDRFENVEQHFDQEIIEVSQDSYVIHEASAKGNGLIKWTRIGSSDVADFKADVGKAIAVPVEAKAWQERRLESRRIIKDGLANPADPKAYKALDALLTDYETRILTKTPFENLDLVGLFYMPRDGVAECLPIVVQNCVLGWYDALRFASESGRAEIVNNERLFGMVYLLGGSAVKADVVKLTKEHPDIVKAKVQLGLELAEKFRNTENYDRQWPSAYGLERMINSMGGNSVQSPLQRKDWDKAWEEAKVKVSAYYGVQ